VTLSQKFSQDVRVSGLLPPGFCFRWEFAVPEISTPGSNRKLLKLPESARIAAPDAKNAASPLRISVGWNAEGLGVVCEVTGKRLAPYCDLDRPGESDGVFLWIDTRNVQDVHRATRFCHLFGLFPLGEGARGDEPGVRQVPVPRAAADAPSIDPDDVLMSAEVEKTGYRLSAWFPRSTLNGFDPVSQPKLGFFCELRDSELGRFPLLLDEEFPYDGDPSLWCSLSLVG
jgi:hypothetical protein